MSAQPGDDDAADASARVPILWRLPRRSWAVAELIVLRDSALVTTMAVVVVLSAFAVQQATRASDDADDRTDHVRVLQAEKARQSGYLQTVVGHDLSVLGPYCEALIDRDVALVTLLTPEPDIAGVVAAGSKVQALRPLMQGDRTVGPCSDPSGGAAGYSVERARQSVATPQNETAVALGPEASGETRAVAESARLSEHERRLMLAGLLFALTLAGLIGIDALSNRSSRPAKVDDRSVVAWQRRLLVLSGVALLAAAVLLVRYVVDPYLLLLVGVILVVAVYLRTWGLASERRHSERPPPTATRSWGAPHWWAEVVGALTLVAFSAAALGLSYVVTRERDERALSDRQHQITQELQQAGHQDALRDLATVARLAILEAEESAANQAAAAEGLGYSEEADEIASKRAELAGQLTRVEGSVAWELADQLRSTADDDCRTTRTATLSPGDLLTELNNGTDGFDEYVFAHQETARACDVLSALTRDNARLWGSRASTFTVALVVLGLAGFLLALAADPDRSRHSARWLLGVGGGGAALGMAASLLVPLQASLGSAPLDERALQQHADDVAAGYHDDCASGLIALDRAISRSDRYGPAFAARAWARFCTAATMSSAVAMSSDVDPSEVRPIIEDLERAMAEGPVTPFLTGNLGWAHILQGLHQGSGGESDLQRGMRLTRVAIESVEAPSAAPGTLVHVLRLNVALAHAGLGQGDAAVLAYAEAVDCLDPQADCPGGGLLDPELRAEYTLWALADLELLPDGEAVDRYREALVGAWNADTRAASEWRGAELDVFAQEVQVSAGDGDPPSSSVIWYHRPDEQTSWGVIRGPSLATLLSGPHLDKPIAAGQLLPTGLYRADLYAGKRRTASVGTTFELDEASTRVAARQLGVSVVVPTYWQVGTELNGVDWQAGSLPRQGVALRRLEGLIPETDIEEFVEQQLDEWIVERFDQEAGTGEDVVDPYFLGLDAPLVRTYDDGDLRVAAAFQPYASSPWCGGSVIMGAVRGDDEDEDDMLRVFDSFVLEDSPGTVPLVTGAVVSDGFVIDVPSGWDAAVDPPGALDDDFSARDCATGTNVIATSEPLDDRSLAAVVDAAVEEYRSDFPQFELSTRSPIVVPGSSQATELRYSWLSDGTEVHQRQVYATGGDTIAYLTFTVRADDVDAYADVSDSLIRSFRLQSR